MQRGLGGFPHERLHQDRVLTPWRLGIVAVMFKLSAISLSATRTLREQLSAISLSATRTLREQLSVISLWVRSQAGSLCHKADH
ncbi:MULTISPECIES: hypothetical protein [Moorena]|uniref:hypothetical protein n=2 Tax=Coleofasciculaceae TaxID=1892251 RepID=UPI0002D802B5|nr:MULTISPECIES: hypothetical protein [Moorena]